jgi:hypothetical protein
MKNINCMSKIFTLCLYGVTIAATSRAQTVVITDNGNPLGLAAASLPTMAHRWGAYSDSFTAAVSGLPEADKENAWGAASWSWSVGDSRFHFNSSGTTTATDSGGSSCTETISTISPIPASNLFLAGVNSVGVNATAGIAQYNIKTGKATGKTIDPSPSGSATDYFFAIGPKFVVARNPESVGTDWEWYPTDTNISIGLWRYGQDTRFTIDVYDNQNDNGTSAKAYGNGVIAETISNAEMNNENGSDGSIWDVDRSTGKGSPVSTFVDHNSVYYIILCEQATQPFYDKPTTPPMNIPPPKESDQSFSCIELIPPDDEGIYVQGTDSSAPKLDATRVLSTSLKPKYHLIVGANGSNRTIYP